MKKQTWIFFEKEENINIYFERCFKVAKERWKEDEVVFYCKFKKINKQHKCLFIQSIDLLYEKVKNSKLVSRLIIDDRKAIQSNIVENLGIPIYRDIFGGIGGFKLIYPLGSQDDYKFWDSHIFNKIARGYKYPGSGYLDYFPYFHIHRSFGQGNTNELGFRFEDYESLKNPQDNKKLIVILGNSGANDVFCTHDEMFSTQLEKKLEKNYVDIVRVVNFSMPSALVLDEINIFNALVYNLKPDIVISHSGYNDFVHSLTNDKTLLHTYDLIYSNECEIIANKIYNKSEFSNSPNYSKKDFEHIKNILIKKIIQFQQIVQSSGAKFIFGLQPALISKKALSSNEKNYLQRCDINLEHRHYKIIFELYEDIAKELQKDVHNFIDFHKIFNKFGEEKFLFFDDVHTNNECNGIIAEIYANYILNSYNLSDKK